MADPPKKKSRVLAALTADPMWDAPSGSQIPTNNLKRKMPMSSSSPAEPSAKKPVKASRFEEEEGSSDAEGACYFARHFADL